VTTERVAFTGSAVDRAAALTRSYVVEAIKVGSAALRLSA